MAALVRLVEAVIERLETRGLETVLTREWDAVRSTSGEERDFCLAAARLGRDPYALDPSVATAIVDAGTHIGGPGLRDFFDAADPDRIPESVAWFRRAQARISRLSGNGVLPTQTQIQGGSELRESRYPWEAGYQDALNFRTALGVEPTGRFDIEEFVPHLVETAPSGRLHAAGGFSTAGTPVVVSGRSMGAAASRFLLARGLWFALTPGDAAGFLVTGAHTARQQAARAFAAELLAPAAGIVELAELGDTGEILDDDVDRVARTFGVSAAVVQRQIENQVLRFEDYRLDDG